MSTMTDEEKAVVYELVDAIGDIIKRHPTFSTELFLVLLQSELVRMAKSVPNSDKLLAKLDAVWIRIIAGQT